MIAELAVLPFLTAQAIASEIDGVVRHKLAYRSEIVDIWLGRDDAYARGSGDCDEFAIAAATEALERGVDPDRLRFVIGYSPWNALQLHMWLEIDGIRVADTAPDRPWMPSIAFPVPPDLPRRGDLKPMLLAVLKSAGHAPGEYGR